MSSPKFQDILTGLGKGHFLTISYRKAMKMRKGQPLLWKVVTRTVKTGTQYDNHETVVDDRIQGKRPAENAGLSGVEWVLYPYVLKNAKGEFQYRFDCEGCRILHSHIEDDKGNIINREDAKNMALKSEFPTYGPDDLKPIVFNIGEKYITHIKKVPVEELTSA